MVACLEIYTNTSSIPETVQIRQTQQLLVYQPVVSLIPVLRSIPVGVCTILLILLFSLQMLPEEPYGFWLQIKVLLIIMSRKVALHQDLTWQHSFKEHRNIGTNAMIHYVLIII